MMRGDFSNWRDERRQNFSGVLHQQGRVLLDADWNAQTALSNDWQDTAGQDIIGAGVAAVPAGQPNGFKIIAATHAPATDNVQLKVNPGRVWADGLLTQLYGAPDPDAQTPVTRTATYLKLPPPNPLGSTASIAKDVRDAVILEVWREEINGFQLPDMLLEPALGGPDTTERIHTACAFRLMRLAPGDTCENIGGRLRDDFSKKGKLKVSLQPPGGGGGDCPTVAGGGYTGFEHNLYRIEIADVDAGPPQFKWSQYGGGLVGRGHFDAASMPVKVTITANQQAITNSGLSSFYLEAVEYDTARGHWRVTYGAHATLSNDTLTLGAKVFGTLPANPKPTDTTFFRLWNDIALVQDYANKELLNNVGIVLAFTLPVADKYTPGDYWTFSVRAGEVLSSDVLVDNEAPQGIHYHRVPLAVVTWANNQDAHLPIEDCRHLFQPLTRLATCCSYRVGDGMHSWGDFDKIQDAINSLPASGGEICVLPGEYKENLLILEQRNITIKGCGQRSRIVAASDAPAVHINVSQNIKLESLAIIAQQKGIGVLLEGPDMQGLQGGTTRDITLEKLYIEAATRCAIEAHIAFAVTIRGCDIEMSDEPSDAPGIFFTGDDSLIEDNIIRVLSANAKKAGGVAGGRTLDTELFQHAQAGTGGLQIGGTSDRVRIVNNLIQGGQGNGITLGSVAEINDGQIFVYYPGSKGVLDPCDSCKDLDDSRPPSQIGVSTTVVSAGALHEIYIERNLIYNMGSNGIGVPMFFDLAKQDEFISVSRLTIVGNEIRRCMQRRIVDIPPNMLNSMGYGGIALADVDNLVARDNVIEHNGLSHLFPICGIFVLHGEGLEISRNRILNNGPNNGVSAQAARPGPRGGIYIVYGITPRVPVLPVPGQKLHVPAMNGVPALKVHENIVSAPLGQALALTALGPVSVVGNQFTSLGVIVRTDSLTFWATTVLIFNLGLSNELYFQLLAFNALAQGQIKSKKGYVINGDTLATPTPGLDDEVLGQYLANGNVLFSNNQCVLDLMDEMPEGAVSSILIASLDDVSFHDNQCDCDLFLGDLIFAQAILFGISLRVTDNRFKEGLFGAWLSAMTLGLLNMTTNNQSTHCLLIRGTKVENFPNTVLLGLFNQEACDPFRNVQPNLGKGGSPTTGQVVQPVGGNL